MGLVSSYRYDKEMVRNDVAKSESALLYEAIQKKKLDDDDVARILCTRNVYQLRSTFHCYNQHYGNPIDEVDYLSIYQLSSSFTHFVFTIRASILFSLRFFPRI